MPSPLGLHTVSTPSADDDGRTKEVNMNKKRFLAAGGAGLLTLALSTGFSAAESRPTSAKQPAATTPMQAGDHDARHAQMRAKMPEDMRAQCDTMRAQMGTAGMDMMQQGGMGSMSGR